MLRAPASGVRGPRHRRLRRARVSEKGRGVAVAGRGGLSVTCVTVAVRRGIQSKSKDPWPVPVKTSRRQRQHSTRDAEPSQPFSDSTHRRRTSTRAAHGRRHTRGGTRTAPCIDSWRRAAAGRRSGGPGGRHERAAHAATRRDTAAACRCAVGSDGGGGRVRRGGGRGTAGEGGTGGIAPAGPGRHPFTGPEGQQHLPARSMGHVPCGAAAGAARDGLEPARAAARVPSRHRARALFTCPAPADGPDAPPASPDRLG